MGSRTSPSPWEVVSCVTGVTSMKVTPKGPCFYFSADVNVEPIGPVLATAAHSAKRLWMQFNVTRRIAAHVVYTLLGRHCGSRAAVISERWVTGGCQLVVFNQVHTEVSLGQTLLKQENKKRKDSPAWCPEIWGLWAGCLSKKVKHFISDCDMNFPFNCWDTSVIRKLFLFSIGSFIGCCCYPKYP